LREKFLEHDREVMVVAFSTINKRSSFRYKQNKRKANMKLAKALKLRNKLAGQVA